MTTRASYYLDIEGLWSDGVWYTIKLCQDHARGREDFLQFERDGDPDDACALCGRSNNEDEQAEHLGLLAREFEVGYYTLVRAAQEGRLVARKSGKFWLSTRRAVRGYLARTTLKPRAK